MGLFKSLKKAVHGLRKGLGLPAITLGNVAKVAGAAAIGGPLAGAAAVLKSRLKSAAVGGVKQVLRSKAEKALVSKVARLAPSFSIAKASSKAIARPGGAPISGAAAGAAAKLKRATHSRRKKRTAAPRTKRRAPTGGLDLKALSVSWKAAGKPGKWIDWVKAHH